MSAGRDADTLIADKVELYRRIAHGWVCPDQQTGRQRLSSLAFRDSMGEISVELSSLTSPAECMARGGPTIIGLVALTVAQVREMGFTVVHDPKPDNPAHALILGASSKRNSRDLSRVARWIYPLDRNPLA